MEHRTLSTIALSDSPLTGESQSQVTYESATVVTESLFAYPELGRFGLAHGIMAWARATVWAEETGAQLVAPIWLRPRIGPYLRRERDKRNYFLLFRQGDAIGGLRRAMLLLFSRRHEAGDGYPVLPMEKGRNLIIFRNSIAGNEEGFRQLVGHGGLLRTRLLEITRPRYHPEAIPKATIALHVRMGDFRPPQGAVATDGAKNVSLPVEWFADRLVALRTALGQQIPAIVYSDGPDEALLPLLSLPQTRRAPRQQSVTDLLSMGQSAVVIASGSNFSLWGAFLGNAARICHPGQFIVPLYDIPDMELETGVGAELPAAFVNKVRCLMHQRH